MPASDDFETFYSAVFRRLVGQLFVVTGDLAEAEDAVQEALARAASRWATVREYQVPEAWVRRVALNLVANGLRRRRSRLAALLRLGPPAPVPAMSEEAVAIAAALRALPVAQRQVVVLHHLLDLPLEQVAQELRVPVGTVKSRLARARHALAAHLGTRLSSTRSASMPELRVRLAELAEAGSRAPRVPGAAAAVRRGRRRRQRRTAGATFVVLVLLAGIVAGRWAGWWAEDRPTTGRPRPPATVRAPFDPDRFLTGGVRPERFDVPPRLVAEGDAKGRHWAFYVYRLAAAGAARHCRGLVDWDPDGRVGGWHSTCLTDEELGVRRKLTLGLDEPVEGELFLYEGFVTKQAARIRFEPTGQRAFEAQRIVDLGPGYDRNWYAAFFSPKGGTRAMLDPRLLTRVTVLDAAGQTICTETFGREPPPAERDGCR